MTTNIFVLGLDEANRRVLESLSEADDYEFHGLLTIKELQHGEDIPLSYLLDRAAEELRAFPGSIDAIIGFWDFPVSSMVAILCEEFGLAGPSLFDRVRCEHKYWSRLEQRKVIDECPDFAQVDPFDEGVWDHPPLPFPFWLKPVKSFSSTLAFRVEDIDSWHTALRRVRRGLHRVGEPFSQVLKRVDVPPEVAGLGANACIAEEQIGGHQATLEGYRDGDEVVIYGIVDSVTYPGTTSFLRYEYPSRLPSEVQERMTEVSQRVVGHLGLHRSTFNIEYFWDPSTDRIRLLEINPRHSQSHARIFADVDGTTTHKLMIDLALGRPTSWEPGRGTWGCSAKWFVRRFDDGVVTRRPSEAEIDRLEAQFPGVAIHVDVEVGDRLSDLHDQDSYSYALASMIVPADNPAEMIEKYDACRDGLTFEFDE